MDLDHSLAEDEFTPSRTHLATAGTGLLPRSAARAVHEAVDASAAGAPPDMFADMEAARASFARLVDVPVARVATGSSVATYTGLIASSLPDGAEVLTADGDFSSLVNPFHTRPGLTVRTVPLERIAEHVTEATALVAVSAVQSADGRRADLTAVREAARAHGARTLVDASQAAGWNTLDADADDYTVCVGFKWLLCPKGTAFLVAPEDLGVLPPLLAGWVAGEAPFDSCYGPVTELARSARRYDESPAMLAWAGARHSLALLERIGTEAVGAHDVALAERFRERLTLAGHAPVPAPGSAIVSVPGLGERAGALGERGITVSDRAGMLRASFHLYNTAGDVDRLVDALDG
ncbi:aminotransferase class V-fold PLP-dependent enzyme [Streptomyces sp. NPDC058374]|uniref:aminotransferase class V-fold PLP-dependent enzyme n=1 Tax=unclassified Streptomyces TaxID=2593676 RepID=UPI00365F2985